MPALLENYLLCFVFYFGQCLAALCWVWGSPLVLIMGLKPGAPEGKMHTSVCAISPPPQGEFIYSSSDSSPL